MPQLTDILAAYSGVVSIEGGAEKLSITSVVSDSRHVKQGAVFVAVRGTQTDGSIYAMDAVAQGAVVVVVDEQEKLALPRSITIVRVHNTRLALAKFAAAFYAPQPAHIAVVTGTDGKTSTAEFFRQLWQMSYKKAASMGTLGVIGGTGLLPYPALNTTPDPTQLHMTLRDLAKDGYAHVALEGSSHGLHQYRLDGLQIKTAAFTNLSRDHLDYHGTLEAYFEAKRRLFSELLDARGLAVLNADDVRFESLNKVCVERKLRTIRYGFAGQEFRIKKISATLAGLAVQAELMGKSHHFMLQMVGKFQAMNALAALGLYMGCGGDIDEALKHLPHLQSVPGRLEKVATHPEGAPVFVDYAHTPAALGNVLTALRTHVKGNLVVVFGCGGDRDKGKRPQMGKVASDIANRVIVTDDNPRSELPAAIRAEVMRGATHAEEIGDRAEAITAAVKGLRVGDALLIAGKGHEKTQIVAGNILPFDDAEVARCAVRLCEESAQ
jgi:UDP-N-acetylmuramoyl-L-alanyl-D-glutamate--2,6-diaminopimelate ligase